MTTLILRHLTTPLIGCCLATILIASSRAAEIDLSKAVVVPSPALSGPGKKAVEMLVDEVRKRTQIRWQVSEKPPGDSVPLITIAQESFARATDANRAAGDKPDARGKEGYRIQAIKLGAKPPIVSVHGNDERGVLFGVGRLLRELRMERGKVAIDDAVNITTSPRYPLRGHQLGYRPKTNSYDAWDLPQWEQYIRDLAVFGTNAVELIPPRSDDAANSPHFPLPPMEMMVGMSKLLADYGLDVSIWYPAMDSDYSDSATIEFALKEWSEVYRQLPRIDAIFVPGGDPGHTRPKYLMAMLEKQTEALHRFHPKAQMWVSPQGFTQEWLDEFYGILRVQQPSWLSGIVFGPQVRVPLAELRKSVPAKYPIRDYPDITHSLSCQYPVPGWDVAYALTEARECINPRPLGEAQIFRVMAPHTVGFLTYSEGCNDDVNKVVWSCLGWDPDANVHAILREYSRYFIGERYADNFAHGLLALERNWRGPLATNGGVETTLQQFRDMERRATPQVRANWRFQQALYRAYYDAYQRRRLLYETELEQQALEQLRRAVQGATGSLPARLITGNGGPAASGTRSLAAMQQAEAILDRAEPEKVAADLRARVFELAEALYQSIRMQLSVPRYQAISVDRGANLDTIDMPLNNRHWLQDRFAALRKLDSEADRLRGLESIVNWTDPGPGGFYDDLGDLARQPHLVPGLGFAKDPACFQSPNIGFGYRRGWRLSWCNHAESLFDAPLKMRYTGLDPQATYKVRVVYAGNMPQIPIRMLANDAIEIHPFIPKKAPVEPVEFDIPQAATKSGELVLTWYREPGRGGNGRGSQVSEVWLMKTPAR